MSIDDLDSRKISEFFNYAWPRDKEAVKRSLNTLLQNPMHAVMFATMTNINRLNFLEYEKIIAQDAEASCFYAINVIHQRFEVGEESIYSKPNTASLYAVHVLKSRCPEAEATIFTDAESTFKYVSAFGRISEAEDILCKDGKLCFKYLHDVVKDGEHHLVKREVFESCEEKLLKLKKVTKIQEYAFYILGGRLGDALHNRMIIEGQKWYVDFLKEQEQKARKFFQTLSDEEKSKLIS